MNSFGILLIGALMVPTKDMVYLALLATGRSLSSEIAASAPNDGSELKGRDSDLASKIVRRLQITPKIPKREVRNPGDAVVGALDSDGSDQARLAISEVITEDRIVTNLERVRFSGSLGLLLSFRAESGYEEFYYRYGDESEFLDDLQMLRSQELVRFNYTDISEAGITFLGKQVICEYHKRFLAPDERCPFSEVTSRDQGIARRLSSPPEIIEELPSAFAVQFCRTSFYDAEVIDLSSGFLRDVEPDSFFRFEIQEEFEGSIEITLKNITATDPFLLVFLGPEDGCQLVAQNDDEPSLGLDSRLNNSNPEPGSYLLATGSYIDFGCYQKMSLKVVTSIQE